MDISQSITIQEQADCVSESKLTDTQNVIRNKFAMAHTNRLENERDVHLALQPLEENHADGDKEEITPDDLDGLCKRLRVLLSSRSVDSADHTQEISAIVTKLREHKIIA